MIDFFAAVLASAPEAVDAAVKSGLREEVPGGLLLVIALAVTIALLLGYVARLALLQKGIAESLREVEKRAGAGAGAGTGAKG